MFCLLVSIFASQEVEWGILTEIGAVDVSSTPVMTLCHDLQVVSEEDLPPTLMEEPKQL